jgi:hypothetical protein
MGELMAENIVSILVVLLVIAVIWTILKLVLKITAKIFSCGCLVILILAVLVFAANAADFSTLP